MVRKGVILAGGKGSRLDPLTKVISKQLLPVYDKPMIFYPLALLMRCEIREILIVTSSDWLASYRQVLGDGSRWGLTIEYAVQEKPSGVPDGLLVACDWLAGEGCCFILGDNLFFGNLDPIREATSLTQGGKIFAMPTREPERFGIVELGAEEEVLSVQEKPSSPRGNLAIPGIYFFDGTAPERAAALEPSAREETEICDLMESYRCDGELRCCRLGRGFVWLDAGTPDDLLEAGHFVATMEKRTGYELACLEEVAWRAGWITDAALQQEAAQAASPRRGDYLRGLLHEGA